jgi:GcrA cell cycle regulator
LMKFAELKPELDEQLAALAAKGMTSAQIGRELGVTKDVVIGRCRRRGFKLLSRSGDKVVEPAPQPEPKIEPICQPKPASASSSRAGKGRAPRQFSRAAPKVAASSTMLLAKVDAPVACDDSMHVDIMGLTPTSCRWPIGDPTLPSFRYCGGQKESLGAPYCSHHMIRAFTPRGLEKVRKGASFGRWC